MNTPSQILYQLADYPSVPYDILDTSESCWVCGFPCNKAVLLNKAIGQSFTDHEKSEAPWSDYLCLPCCWVMSGRPPDSFRPWSVVWRSDKHFDVNPDVYKSRQIKGVHFTKKIQPNEIVSLLSNPPKNHSYFCSIALTGQKHVIPFTKINHSSDYWTIRTDSYDITSSVAVFNDIFNKCQHLLQLNFSKIDIETGTPYSSKLKDKQKREIWKSYEFDLVKWRGSNFLKLILWLVRK